MATAPSSASHHADAPVDSTARRVRLIVTATFLLGVAVQFYLAGRGAFGAGTYEAHETLGGALQGIALIIVLVALGFKELRNGPDLGPPVVLLVLVGLQSVLAQAGDEVAALHVLNALLIFGAGMGIVSRDRRLGGAGA